MGEVWAAGVKVANCFCCFAEAGLDGEGAAAGVTAAAGCVAGVGEALGTHALALARRLALVGDTGELLLPFLERFCSSVKHSPTRAESGL